MSLQLRAGPDSDKDAKNEQLAFKSLINGMKSLIGRVYCLV